MALIVGNWKMNLTVEQASLLVERLSRGIEHPQHDIVLCPGFVAVYAVAQILRTRGLTKLFALGVQNINDHDEGAFTGEVSGPQVRDLVDYAIIGHSERRTYYGEDDALIARKLAAAVRHELTPILCVGETLVEHEASRARSVVSDQLREDLDGLTAEDAGGLVVAYEPVWAIGNGKFDSPDDAGAMMGYIREALASHFGQATAKQVRILYGGSVDDANAASYLALSTCNGLLVGHESINAEQFARIAHA